MTDPRAKQLEAQRKGRSLTASSALVAGRSDHGWPRARLCALRGKELRKGVALFLL